MRIRVLFAWDGNSKPHEPGTVVEIDDELARPRIRDGHAERVDEETPLTSEPDAEPDVNGDADDEATPADDDAPSDADETPELDPDVVPRSDDGELDMSALSRLNRDGLNAVAVLGYGLADAAALGNKNDVIDAIVEAERERLEQAGAASPEA